MKNIQFKSKSQSLKQANLSYIGSVNASAKIAKNSKKNTMTYVVYLAPHTISGRNTCAGSTKECRDACLVESGRALMDKKNILLNAKIKRTNLFYENREVFMRILVSEIQSAKDKAERKGMKFSVRLNGTSDLNPKIWKLDGKNILELFPTVQFYDYTKIANRMDLMNEYPNYHLTYSYTGYNTDKALETLKMHKNVAIVFDTLRNKDLPKTWHGYKVIDADETDLRYLDEKGTIAGLRFKRVKNSIDKIESKFIVNA